MYQIKEVNGIKGYKTDDDQIFLNLEDIVRKIGIIKENNNSIRWNRVKDMIDNIMSNLPPGSRCSVNLGGYSKIGANSFISQELAYMLAMAARNQTAIQFQYELATVIIPGFLEVYSNYNSESSFLGDMQYINNEMNKPEDDLSKYVANIAKSLGMPTSLIIHNLINDIMFKYGVDIPALQNRFCKKVNGKIQKMSAIDIINLDDNLRMASIELLHNMIDRFSGYESIKLNAENQSLKNELEMYKSKANGKPISIAYRPSEKFGLEFNE